MNIREILRKSEVILMIIIILFIIIGSIIFTIILTNRGKDNKEKEEYVQELEQIEAKEKEEDVLTVTRSQDTPEPTPQPEAEPTPVPLDPMYQGYPIAGKITIPKTGVSTPFLDSVSVSGMEIAPCLLLKKGEINQQGYIYIVGHNFRNGTLFSDNGKLEVEDKITITAMDGTSRDYQIYDKFITTAEDTSFLKRDVSDHPEVILQSCTDDDENRIIILAK